MSHHATVGYLIALLSAVLVMVVIGSPNLSFAGTDEKAPALPAATAAPAASDGKAAPAALARGGQAAPYANSKITKERFGEITAEDMEMLRSKKILFASRSFGLNLCNGLRGLAAKDKKYEFLSSMQRYDVNKAGGNVGVIPADAYKDKNFVHFLASMWPLTKRVDEIDQLLRQKPHEFGKTVDIVIIFYHMSTPQAFDHYATKMDALRRDFPQIKFIYTTAAFMADTRAKENEQSHAFSELVRARYKGQVPLYDLGAILSDDFRVGHAYCPEYSKDPAGVHPNLPAGEQMMAKGFLLVLRDAYKWQGAANVPALPPAAQASPTASAAGAAQVETLPADHPDYQAVRAILDANGLKEKKVEGVAVVEKGRIVKLHLQEGGISELPEAIGVLTELRVLHLYGDRNLPHKLLQKISPAIGRCTKLEDLLLNQNDLQTLPVEIAALTQLKSLSLADNRLKDLPPAVVAWATRFDPKGLAQQNP